LHLAKVQKNFDSKRTVNFPALKLGNFLWPVKTLKNDEKNVKANNNNKTTLNPNVGVNNNFLVLKIDKRKKLSKNFNSNDTCIFLILFCLKGVKYES